MGCKEFTLEMVKLFKAIWKTDKIPINWGRSKLVALSNGPSKIKQNNPKSYLGLQIGFTLCKILFIPLIDRLRTWYEKQLIEQQQVFRPRRGTADRIYIVKIYIR